MLNKYEKRVLEVIDDRRVVNITCEKFVNDCNIDEEKIYKALKTLESKKLVSMQDGNVIALTEEDEEKVEPPETTEELKMVLKAVGKVEKNGIVSNEKDIYKHLDMRGLHINRCLTRLHIASYIKMSMEKGIELTRKGKAQLEKWELEHLRKITREGKKMMKELVKISLVEETSYEDGSWWVEYEINNKTGIELIQGTEEETKKDIIEKFSKIDIEKLLNKIDLSSCSEKMQEVINNCICSYEGTWFIEEGDITEKELNDLAKEAEKLGLDGCMIEYEEEETPMTIYGETITKFLY